MILGALIGRCYVLLLAPCIEVLVEEDERGALMARFAVVGAAAFASAVCRTFAVPIMIFEVLMVRNSILPMSSASLASILVSNSLSLPFFEMNLVASGLGGISALTSTKLGEQPIHSIMRRLDLHTECIQQCTTLRELQQLLASPEGGEHFAIVHHDDVLGESLLQGSVSRESLEHLLLHAPAKNSEETLDLLKPALRLEDGSLLMVSRQPLTVPPTMTVQDVYIVMKTKQSNMVYVVDVDDVLVGCISFRELLSQQAPARNWPMPRWTLRRDVM
eukprot:gnl/TRDRNA2_/TRDRNA2_132071_c2_seq2.p1 gnl/TRDRNA2_/TRDRNA2_132071_c2~~gnl/TRDRNA2_/TRDRNA2_132071_c2_seq2.p1  ORF type:complete len:275 (+),score=53.69 gnl/TRDRNA2_/TRDRNA2_132071_c2_seq2:124-948(+)